MKRNDSNENNVSGVSVRDGIAVCVSSDCISSTLDSIRQSPSVFLICAVHLSMCHCHATQVRSSPSIYTLHYYESEVGSYWFLGTSSGCYPTSFYYDRGVML